MTMTETPGLDLLMRLTGRSRDELLHDPRALAEAVGLLGDSLVDLIVGVSSPDPRRRTRAETERGRLLAEMRQAPLPADRLRGRLSGVLDDALRAVRDEI